MQKFCTKCGGKLDENTGKCPNCDRIAQGKNTQSPVAEGAKKKSSKLGIKIMLIVLSVIILAAGTTCALQYFGVINIPALSFIGNSKAKEAGKTDADKPEKVDKEEEEAVEEDSEEEIKKLEKEIEDELEELKDMQFDADDYFHKNSTVVSEVKADESPDVHTEAEVYEIFQNRGFVTDYPIETMYSINGDRFESTPISDSSSTMHPYYQTNYVDSNGNGWIIYEINGVIMANPLSYNAQSGANVMLIISENETVTSYDNGKNKFYETIPNKSELDVRTIDKIDSEALDRLTFEEIDRL